MDFLVSLSFSRWVVRLEMEPARLLKVEAGGAVTADGAGVVGVEGWMCWSWRFLWNSVMWQSSGVTEMRGGSLSFAAAHRKKITLLQDCMEAGVVEVVLGRSGPEACLRHFLTGAFGLRRGEALELKRRDPNQDAAAP